MTLGQASLFHETERLRLRPFRPEDWAFYADCHSRGEVYRYLYAAAPTGQALEERFRRVLGARFERDGDMFRLAVTAKADDAPVGEVVLKLASREALQGEIGYIFHPASAGQGFATEAAAAMLDIGFEEIGFHRIFARLDTENAGSVGVVERLGLRREAHLIQNDRFDSRWGDEYVYAMLKAEWRERAARRPICASS
ncbi:acetyltransferase [Aureimonas ureilytica]|uniref:Acetyltransferase n=1 Tax=Aureimonas ureilytica TaxID=401562 RepID=A0A175R373_9HYPH|nr:GNAT family protein [Aureimonas ureilytica]KTQ83131.1 acetyltransferase [Aureimonas ureilytica]